MDSLKQISKKTVLVVCHDAGGAEIVSAFIARYPLKYHWECYVDGPAQKIFRRKHIAFHRAPACTETAIKRLFDRHADATILLTGTSWSTTLELLCIREGKDRSMKTIAYIDGWTNHRGRFGSPHREWKKNLPDEIWVGDHNAYEVAQKNFLQLPIRLVKNYYWEEIKREVRLSSKKEKLRPTVLFLSEPLAAPLNSLGDKSGFYVTERHILLETIRIISGLAKPPRVIIRLHPAEEKNKYDDIVRSYGQTLDIECSHASLAYDLGRADMVIGIQGMAMVLAYLTGRLTVSILPDPRMRCPAPFPIQKMRSFRSLKMAIVRKYEKGKR